MEEKNKKALQYLPHELIIQILLRLPVKSLVRFKCVCKSWFSLISDPHFANSHFQLSSGKHTSRILLMSTSTPRESRSIDFEAPSLDDDSASVSRNLNFMPFQSYLHIEIKGSCRGFLLLHCYGQHWIYDIYLWNPSTGFHKNIPLSPSASKLEDNYFYGFGYDHSTDDYLLVTMSSEDSYNQLSVLHLEFFSLRANTWKEIEGTQFSYSNIMDNEEPTSAGFLFNGAIHWFAYRPDLGENVIVAFDLMEKKLFNMHLPDDFDRGLDGFGLWVFGESLCIWAENSMPVDFDDDDDYIENHRLELKYGLGKNTKCIHLGLRLLFCLLMAFLLGQLLEHHTYCKDARGLYVAMYIESLLSLPGDNKQA
ncbi:hypothetical protein TSUD_196740 [Trifolium subterraneum]|uniref:F-box domain-containing protein n=1 Tax=Trifolium subterraneum TaxID=3900 RepID=A0A2Z6NA62_TRISU|nr:hypothetical protein TSUD_196740 [Trifolium subterraneum]